MCHPEGGASRSPRNVRTHPHQRASHPRPRTICNFIPCTNTVMVLISRKSWERHVARRKTNEKIGLQVRWFVCRREDIKDKLRDTEVRNVPDRNCNRQACTIWQRTSRVQQQLIKKKRTTELHIRTRPRQIVCRVYKQQMRVYIFLRHALVITSTPRDVTSAQHPGRQYDTHSSRCSHH